MRTAVAMELVDLAIQAVDGTKDGYDALRGLLERLERASTLRLRTRREKTLLLPACLRNWPTRRF